MASVALPITDQDDLAVIRLGRELDASIKGMALNDQYHRAETHLFFAYGCALAVIAASTELLEIKAFWTKLCEVYGATCA